MYNLYGKNNIFKINNLSVSSVDGENYFVWCVVAILQKYLFSENSRCSNIFDSNRWICFCQIPNFNFIVEQQGTEKRELNPGHVVTAGIWMFSKFSTPGR